MSRPPPPNGSSAQIEQDTLAGNTDRVSQLLDQLQLARTPDKSFLVPCLVAAASQGFVDLVAVFVAQGVPVGAPDSKRRNRTALHAAAEAGRLSVVQSLLLTHGAPQAVIDGDGDTPLLTAVRRCVSAACHVELLIVAMLLRQLKPAELGRVVNAAGNGGDTALHIALALNNAALAALLIRFSGDLSITNSRSQKPLDLCSNEALRQQLAPRNVPMGVSVERPPAPSKEISTATPDDVIKPVHLLTITGPPSALTQLQQRVNDMYNSIATPNDAFAAEFAEMEALSRQLVASEQFNSAQLEVNRTKNRYTNILPFERTRVKLQPIDGVPGSDYINANWINGEAEGSERAYIATQGPKENTVADFWRMIWECGVFTIVMLGTHIEPTKEGTNVLKFFQYWPESDSLDAGDIRIVFRSRQDNIDDIVVRNYQLVHATTGKTRDLTLFQFVSFRDHGVPEKKSAESFLRMVGLVDRANRKERTRSPVTPPLVVHCSAGVGRTGTFCALHAVSTRVEAQCTSIERLADFQLNVLDSVRKLRLQRSGLIQTKEQLMFCYVTILGKVHQHFTIMEYPKEPWFHGSMSAQEANSMLFRQAEGSFLFRPSSNVGCLSLSYIDKKREILHVRITVTPKGFKCEGDKHAYLTLAKLVATKKSVLKSPINRI